MREPVGPESARNVPTMRKGAERGPHDSDTPVPSVAPVSSTRGVESTRKKVARETRVIWPNEPDAVFMLAGCPDRM